MGKISQYSDVPVPKLSDMLIGTSVGLNEDDQVENQTYNFTLQQLLDLFVPNIPSNNLQGVLDNGNTATQDINLFGKITTIDLEVTNDATFNNAYFPENMYVPGLIFDETYVSGTNGQVLSRTATGVKWITLPDIFTPNLQQVLNIGNVASTNIQLSATLFADAVDADDIISNISLAVSGELIDKDGASGLNGQVLTSTGSGKVQWQNFSTYIGVSPINVNNGTKEISITKSGSTSDGYLSSSDWNAFDSKQDGLFGTGLVKSTAGVITYITDGSSDWNIAYNNMIISASVDGTSTKTLTLNQQDGGTITTSWIDESGGDVTSVFGRTGDVVAQNGDYNTSQVTESTNLYYTDARARAAISLTTNGTSGAATYNSTTGILNIPNYGGSSTGYVPYTGATNDVLLGTHYLSADYLKISTTTAHSASVAEIVWNANNGTFDMGLLNGVTLQAGQEFHFYGKASGAIPNGSPVMFAGAQGNHLLMSVATPSVINAHPEYFVGVATQAFTNNQFGYITVFGQVRDLNTIAYPEGTVLYFNSVSGGFTTTVPSAPNAKIIVAAVVRSHATQGSLMVRPHVMPMLSDIQDVGVSGLAENDVLVYDTNKWVNKTIAEILGYTPASLSSFSASSPLSYNNTTGAFSIQQANGSQNGYLSSTDWTTFNNKIGGSLITNNIPKATGTAILGNSSIFDDGSSVYVNTGSGPNTSKLIFTTSGVGSFLQSYQNLTAENNNIFINYSGGNVAIGTVSSPSQKLEVGGNVKANSFIGSLTGNASTASALYSPRTLTIGNTGKSFDGTANVSWTLGEIGAQAAGNYITSLTGEATASGPGAAAVTLTTSAVTGKILSGLNITGGTVVDTDTILTAFGKLQNQINGLIGGSIYKGTWNASTNTPTLTSSVGTKGWYYIVNVAGTTNLNGITDWQVGDWAIFDGSAWQKVDNTDAVVSVNGFTGAVSLTTANIPEATNLYYTDTRARSALSFAAGSGAYNSSTGVITIPTNTSQLTNGANFITLTSLSASSPLSYNNGTGAFSIQQATSSQDGYISSTDWSTFNGKVSSQWTTSGSNIYYNGGNVGIGTESPTSKLDIRYNSTNSPYRGVSILDANSSSTSAHFITFQKSDESTIGIIRGSGTSNAIFVGGIDHLGLGSNNIERMRITSSGNVGIGTTSPNAKLQVEGQDIYLTGNTDNRIRFSNYGFTGNSMGAAIGYIYGIANTQEQGNIAFYTNPNFNSTGSLTERMRITSSGNVGIGTTSPSTKLDVAGAVKTSSNAYGTEGGYYINPFGSNTSSRSWALNNDLYAFGDFSIRQSTTQTGSTYLDRFYINPSGNIGIGTTNPTKKLEVAGAIKTDRNGLTFPSYLGNKTWEFASDGTVNDGAYFYATGTGYVLTLASSGNVGIGTTSPSEGIGTTSTGRVLDIYDSSVIGNNGGALVLSALGNQSRKLNLGQIRTILTDGTPAAEKGDMSFSTMTSSILSERMRITSSGNVGIGTTSPSYKLDVSGDIAMSYGSSLRARNYTYSKIIEATWNGSYDIVNIYTAGDGAVNSSPKITILSNGNVGIGTTSPVTKLQVVGNGLFSNSSTNWAGSDNIGLLISGSSGGGATSFISTYLDDTSIQIGAGTTQKTGIIINGQASALGSSLDFRTGGGTKMFVNSSGNVGIGTTSPATKLDVAGAITASGGFFNSDIRLKEITDYKYSVSDIKPITYTWKDKRDDKKHIGYSAQEVQKVMPDAVNEDAEGMLSVNYVEVLVAQIDFLNKRILELEKIISK